MANTKEGGKKHRQTMINKFGSEEKWREWMAERGREGGRKSRTGGFHYSKVNGLDTHIRAGSKGGKISKRTKVS